MGFGESIKESTNPEISIFVPFTRLWVVDEFLTMLSSLDLPRGECELVFFNDTNDRTLQSVLRDYLCRVRDQYNGCTIYCSNNAPPTETDAMIRRSRILAMKKKSVDLVGNSRYVFCLEDDTFPVNKEVFMNLYSLIQKENVGFVSGVERGRWGFGVIGGWRMDNVEYPKVISTIPFKDSGVEPIDGGGWYCYMTPTKLYKSIDYRYEAECLGPDVCYVKDIRCLGYDAFIDWNERCIHRTTTTAYVSDDTSMVVCWKRVNDQWLIMNPM